MGQHELPVARRPSNLTPITILSLLLAIVTKYITIMDLFTSNCCRARLRDANRSPLALVRLEVRTLVSMPPHKHLVMSTDKATRPADCLHRAIGTKHVGSRATTLATCRFERASVLFIKNCHYEVSTIIPDVRPISDCR